VIAFARRPPSGNQSSTLIPCAGFRWQGGEGKGIKSGLASFPGESSPPPVEYVCFPGTVSSAVECWKPQRCSGHPQRFGDFPVGHLTGAVGGMGKSEASMTKLYSNCRTVPDERLFCSMSVTPLKRANNYYPAARD